MSLDSQIDILYLYCLFSFFFSYIDMQLQNN